MSVLAELQSGTAGDEFTALLQRTIRAVGVARNFPPPEGHGQWDVDAVGSAAAEFMSDSQTPRRLTDLAVHCATDHAVRARLQGTVRNFLADLGRRTPIGKLVVRINDVLSREPGVRPRRGPLGPVGRPHHRRHRRPRSPEPGHPGPHIVVPAWGRGRGPGGAGGRPGHDRRPVRGAARCGRRLAHPPGAARAIGHRLGIGQAPVSIDVNAFDHPGTGTPPAPTAPATRRCAISGPSR